MRHVFLPRSIPTSPLGMRQPAGAAQLIASSGRALSSAPRQMRAITDAVDLPAIATATDDRLAAAARTEKQPRRARLTLSQVANAP